MMIAITAVFLLLDRALANTLTYYLMFIMPLPMVFYGAKYGWKGSWAVYAALILVAFVVNDKDQLVAFLVTMPHISSGVRKAKGRIFPFGWMHILPQLNARKNHITEGLLIGVLPEYQAKGAVLLMLKYLHENYIRLGIKRMLMNPQLEDNHKVQTLFGDYDPQPYQRRRSYVMEIRAEEL